VSTQHQPSVWRAPSRISFVVCPTCGKAMKTMRVQRPTRYIVLGLRYIASNAGIAGTRSPAWFPGQKA
jgi:hypothetical protein